MQCKVAWDVYFRAKKIPSSRARHGVNKDPNFRRVWNLFTDGATDSSIFFQPSFPGQPDGERALSRRRQSRHPAAVESKSRAVSSGRDHLDKRPVSSCAFDPVRVPAQPPRKPRRNKAPACLTKTHKQARKVRSVPNESRHCPFRGRRNLFLSHFLRVPPRCLRAYKVRQHFF